jgi:hypothetical protein
LENENLKIEHVVSNNGTDFTISSGIDIGNKFSGSYGGTSNISESETITKRRARYYEVIDELKTLILSLLISSKQSVTIFYDDMDQFEESMEFEYFLSLMKNMIYSADKLNHILSEYNHSRVCLVLREDIVDLLQARANNLNKQITDNGIRISWTEKGTKQPHEHPLMQMILHKIKKSGDEYREESLQNIYEKLFEQTVFDFLLERSFGRPRDIISYLNIYKDEFPDYEKITIRNLQKIEQRYSKWFFDELLNELALAEKKESINEVFRVITRRGYTTFNYSQVQKFFEENITEYKAFDNLLEILAIMREYSILGIKIQKKFDFVYRTGFSTGVDKNSKFVVHRGLQKYLNLM